MVQGPLPFQTAPALTQQGPNYAALTNPYGRSGDQLRDESFAPNGEDISTDPDIDPKFKLKETENSKNKSYSLLHSSGAKQTKTTDKKTGEISTTSEMDIGMNDIQGMMSSLGMGRAAQQDQGGGGMGALTGLDLRPFMQIWDEAYGTNYAKGAPDLQKTAQRAEQMRQAIARRVPKDIQQKRLQAERVKLDQMIAGKGDPTDLDRLNKSLTAKIKIVDLKKKLAEFEDRPEKQKNEKLRKAIDLQRAKIGLTKDKKEAIAAPEMDKIDRKIKELDLKLAEQKVAKGAKWESPDAMKAREELRVARAKKLDLTIKKLQKNLDAPLELTFNEKQMLANKINRADKIETNKMNQDMSHMGYSHDGTMEIPMKLRTRTMETLPATQTLLENISRMRDLVKKHKGDLSSFSGSKDKGRYMVLHQEILDAFKDIKGYGALQKAEIDLLVNLAGPKPDTMKAWTQKIFTGIHTRMGQFDEIQRVRVKNQDNFMRVMKYKKSDQYEKIYGKYYKEDPVIPFDTAPTGAAPAPSAAPEESKKRIKAPAGITDPDKRIQWILEQRKK